MREDTGRGRCGTKNKEVNEMLPGDPVMLLSVVNTKLRDFYGSLDVLCEEMDADKQELTEKLAAAGYRYDEERNQFVQRTAEQI